MLNTPERKPAKRLLTAALLAAALGFAGCGGGGGTGLDIPPIGVQPGGGGDTGTLVLFAEDQLTGILAFELTVSGATLVDSSGDTVSVLASPVALEWRSRGLAPTLLSITEVPPGTYTELRVTVSSPEMTVFDPLDGTFSEIQPALVTSSVTIDLDLDVVGGDVTGLRLDLDLRNSVELDSSNNFVVNPLFAGVPTSFVVGQLPGDIDDVLGTVQTVTSNLSRFTFRALGSNETITVNTNASTLFDGVSGLSNLQVNDRVELDARLQQGGTFLAQELERETAGGERQLRGLVLARTPATGLLTSFDLLVVEADPAVFSPGAIVTLSTDANTDFRLNLEDLPSSAFPNQDFDRQTVRPGQFVHVVERSGTTLEAGSVALEEITLTGQVGATVGNNSFSLRPEDDFFQDTGLVQITVNTSTVTELEDLPAGLGSLQPNQSIVAARGVLVFQAGNGVLVAKRVRLLP